MTLQERIVRKYVDQAVEEFEGNPLSQGFLRRLSIESPDLFFPAAIDHLKSDQASNAHQFLAGLTLGLGSLANFLVDPVACTRQSAVKLVNRFLTVAPSFDVRLARNLSERFQSDGTPAFDRNKTLRALDILDETSPGRRLLPILGHLPSGPDAKIAAKATLFVGKRVQSPAWSARYLASGDERVRANAVEAIWGVKTPHAIHLLEECVEDRNNRVAGNALIGLHIAGSALVDPHVRTMSHDENATVRSTAAWIMGTIGTREWIEPLTQLIKDEDPKARSMALRSLARLNRTDAAEEHPEPAATLETAQTDTPPLEP